MKIELQAIEGVNDLEQADKRVRLLLDAGSGNFAIVTVRVVCASDSVQEIKEAAIKAVAHLLPRDESPDAPRHPAGSFS